MNITAAHSVPETAPVPRPGLPGFADDDVVEMKVIEQAHGIAQRTGLLWRRSPNGLPHIVVGQGVLVIVGSYRKWLRSREIDPGATRGRRRSA